MAAKPLTAILLAVIIPAALTAGAARASEGLAPDLAASPGPGPGADAGGPSASAVPLPLPPSAPHLRIEPEAELSVPQPLQVGVGIYRNENLRFFADTGFFRTPSIGNIKSISLFNVQTGVRCFSLARWFYFGAAIGYRHIGLTSDLSSFRIADEAVASSGSISLSTAYAEPSVGVEFPVSRRISLGMNLGYQLPVLASGRMNLEDASTGEDSSNSETLKVNSNAAMSRVAALKLPQLTLVRLVWHLE